MSGGRSSTGRLNSTNTPRFFIEIAELISHLYPDARKIVEVGAGRSPYTAAQLQKLLPHAEIIVTDIDPCAVMELEKRGLKAILDDASNPRLEIYVGADLIYSIRPPFELIPSLEALADKTGADVLLIPLSEDAYLSNISGSGRWVGIRRGGLTAYILRGI